MSKPSVEVYATQDLIDDVDEYADEHDISRSAAWRELVRYGLQAVETGKAAVDGGGGE